MMPNKRLLGLVPEAKKYMMQKVIFSWMSLLAGIIMWFCVGEQIEAVKDGGGVLLSSLLLAAGCICFRYAFARLISDSTQKAVASVKTKLRSDLYGKLTRLGSGYDAYFPTAEVVQLSGEGVEQLESYFGNYIPQFFYAMLAPLTLLIVFLPLSPLTGVVLFLCVPLIPVTIAKIQRFAKKMLGKYWDAYANLGDSFLENLQGLTTLKVYGADEERHAQMNVESEHFRVVTMKVLTMQLNSVTIMDFVAYGGTALGCILTARSYLTGGVNFGQAFAMVMLSSEFFLAMRALGSYFHTAMNGVAASERMFHLLDVPEREDGKEQASGGAICLDGLTFSYEEGNEALHAIDAVIPEGAMCAVVGESGCGKSTLAAILAGERPAYTGSVRLGGAEIRDIAPENLRETVTVVSDASYLFEGTVREALLWGKTNASEEEMKDALQKAAIWDFFADQGGLDFVLLERGSNLSGGQRQRLALARALLKDSPVYIFDEATSNIDAESEEAIMDAVRAMKGRHTIVLISHRLANVVEADEILYLEKGVLAEAGTHDDLLARSGGYAALFTAQKELETVGSGERPAPVTIGGGEKNGQTASAAGLPGAEVKTSAGELRQEVKRSQRNPGRAETGAKEHVLRETRRSGWQIMRGLLSLLSPLSGVMLLCITLGTLGYLAAIFITVLAGHLLLTSGGQAVWKIAFGGAAALMVILAVLRAIFRYSEQTCGHYIAFKLLAVIRDRVFGALRRLAPARLEGRGRGDLIAVITGNIELLEVFYAHTIAPVCIAFIVSVMMTFVIGSFHPAAGLLAANSYALIGIALPILTSHMGREAGRKARNRLGGLNNVFLESLRGIREVLQFGQGEIRRRDIEEKTAALNEVQAGIRRHEGTTGAAAGALVMALPILMLLLGIAFKLPFPALVMTTISLAASFGPVLALANLSAAMDSTLAAGERVLALLEEEPETPDVTEGERPSFSEAALFDVTFSYDRELILKDLTAAFPGGTITAVTGPSGVGKSTLLKLLMRFWEADAGAVRVSGVEVGRIETAHLRSLESYMTQDTDLFNVSIRDNIRIGRLDASDAEVEEAARKASIHDFIMTLPDGYDTKTGELGERLSGGERQRIGLARAFLHGAPLLLLDEPTSNLDSLNEGVILKALRAEAKESGRTVVLVSHRVSTTAVADRAYAME